MQPDEMLKLAKKEKLADLETAWTASAGDYDGRLATLIEIPEVLAARGHRELAESLLWYLVDTLTEAGRLEEALDAAEAAGRLLPRSSLIRDLLISLYPRVHDDRADIEDLVSVALASPDLPLNDALDGIANLMSVHPGTYVIDPQRGEVGRVERLDAERGGLVLTTDQGEKVYGTALVGRLMVIDEDDFRALSVFERERLAEMAKKNPEELVNIVLSSLDRRMELRRLRLYLEPVVGAWGRWWSKARDRLKRSAAIGMTEGRSPSLFLRSRPLTHGERLAGKFDAASAPVAKLAMALHIETESRGHGGLEPEVRRHVVDEVAALARGSDGSDVTRMAAASVARLLCRQWEDIPEPELPEGPDSIPSPDELARSLTHADVLLCALDAVRRRSPQAWEQICAGVMPLIDRDACGLVARRLRNAEADEALAEARREILLRSDGHPGALAWLWRDLTAPGTAANEGDVDGAAVLMGVLSRLAALVRARGIGEEARRDHIAELRASIFVREATALRAALEGAEPHQLAAIKALGERNPALTDRMQADLVNALQAVSPALFERRIDPWDEDVIYSTEAGVAKRRADLEEIVNVRLPEVIREIGAAAGFGDISDNAEYQSAVMERARLAERAGRMQEEITEARLITSELASADHVTIGSRVTARNAASGEEEVMTFLGPWDARPEERIYAYNAPLGKAFMGREVGDEVVYRMGPEERRWEIAAIEPAV